MGFEPMTYGIWTHDLYDTGAVLYTKKLWTSYQLRKN